MAAFQHVVPALVILAAISWGTKALSASSDARDLLWPLPEQYSFSGSPVTVDSTSFQFTGEGAGGKSATLQAAFGRYKGYLFDQGTSTTKGVIAGLTVVVKSSSESLNQETDESCEFLGSLQSRGVHSCPAATYIYLSLAWCVHVSVLCVCSR